ncbi:MAG: hypothetical protein DHS20C20_01490 [Ardenticatenaceae bacterium]|nr:MAG: hypothetical protein DHS20C20_01490 [Ardenticatenaceae bacterium]
MLETIQQSVKHHDQYQIEIKLDYELHAAQKTRYQIATFFFVPRSLGITTHTYPKHAFYQDVQSHIRLKTPSLNLREFTDGDRSPLCLIEKMVRNAEWLSDSVVHDQLITQMKLLSTMIKSALREHFILIEQRVAEVQATPHGKTHYLVHNLVDEFITEAVRVTERYRELLADFNLPNVPRSVFNAFLFTDESLSILIEESAVAMFQIVDEYLKKTNREDYKMALSELTARETKYRKTRGYESILIEGGDNEAYLYRASILKKYASSVLYLNTDVRPDGQYWEQLILSLAAGLAMIFATAVAFYFQYEYGNFTLPFFIALVVGYMFKDRIKEVSRIIFAKRLENHLFDRRTIIRTQDGQHRLGILREKVRFISEDDVPLSVLRARNRDQITELSNDGRGENIICYTKDIELRIKNMEKVLPGFPEITGINDILRFDVRHFLNKMAEPVQERHMIQQGELVSLLCHKVYHVNLISRYKTVLPGVNKENRHQRLILDQSGIRRLEDVPRL